jgi:hypothetical protein
MSHSSVNIFYWSNKIFGSLPILGYFILGHGVLRPRSESNSTTYSYLRAGFLSCTVEQCFLISLHVFHHNCFKTICKISVRTSQETHYVSSTKTERLILFGQSNSVPSEIHARNISTLLGKMQSFITLKQVVHVVTTEF